MKVKSISTTRLHAASHVEFNQAAYTLINDAQPLAIPALTELLPLWKAAADVEDKLVRRQRGSALTAQVEEADKLRDNAMYELFLSIDAGLKSSVTEKKAAADMLAYVVKPYRKDAYDQLTDQTQDIDGMLYALGRTEELIDAQDALNVGAVVQGLKKANNKFKDIYAQRVAESEAQAAISEVGTPEQRKIVDNYYRQVTDLLEAASLMLATAERTAVEAVITSLNALVEQYKLVLANQAKTRTGGDDEKIDREVDRLRLQAAEAEIKQKRLEEKAARAAEKAAEKLRKAEEKERKRK